MTFPGRLAVWNRSAGNPKLALGFSSEVITLHVAEDGDWAEVGSADVAAADFPEQIEALRVEALVRDKAQSPITIWLPADQVIERHYTLAATSEDARRAEASRRIADETPHTAHELSVAIASESRFEPVKVLAVLLQTMIEARSYAAGWGFTPGQISTRVGRRGFEPPGPVFEFPRSVANRAGRTVRRLAVAATALVAVGGAAFGAYQMVQPLLQGPVAASPLGPSPASFAVFMDPPSVRQAPLSEVEKTAATSLALPGMGTDAVAATLSAGSSVYARLGSPETPRGLEAPDGNDPLKVGTAPDTPSRDAIAGKTVPPADGGNTILAALDPTARVPDPTLGGAPEPAADETGAAAPEAPTPADPAAETPATTSPATTSPASETPVAETPVTDPELAPTKFAPEKVAMVPLPRPGSTGGGGDAPGEALNLPAPRPESLVRLGPEPPAARVRPESDRTPDSDGGPRSATAAAPEPATGAIPVATAVAAPVAAATAAAPGPAGRPDADAAAGTTDTAAATAPFAPPDPRPANLAATAGIASDILRRDAAGKPSPDDGATAAAIGPTRLALPAARPDDLVPPGSARPAEPPAEDGERLALAPATADLRVDRPDDDDTDITTLKAPEPSRRPRALEFAARRMPARTRTPLSVYLPRSVGDAARRTGLALDKTNLIGVIEAKDGRQALVRLPDGGFRKVGEGDSLDGWRVGAVNRESVRLTRKGEKRTLLLVTP